MQHIFVGALVVGLIGLVGACQGELAEQDPGPAPAKKPRVIEREATVRGVDCDLIGASLTSLELGNYASRQERGPREAELAGRCRDAGLTVEEAKCVLGATKTELAYCPKPIAVAHQDRPKVDTSGLPPACAQCVIEMEQYSNCAAIPEASRPALRDAARQMKQGFGQISEQNNPEAWKTTNQACEQALDAIKQSLHQLNCQ